MDTIQEGNKLICQFDGMFLNEYDQWQLNDPAEGNFYYLTHELKYHTSFDWQIPAWSKAINQLISLNSELAPEGVLRFGPFEEKLRYFMDHYQAAVNNNSPLDGFKVLVEAITFLNSHNEKAQR